MTILPKKSRRRAAQAEPAPPPPVMPPAATKLTRTDTLIARMRGEGGASAGELAQAVGWQVHSVRGFISGTLKKRTELEVTTGKVDGVTHYRVRDRQATQA